MPFAFPFSFGIWGYVLKGSESLMVSHSFQSSIAAFGCITYLPTPRQVMAHRYSVT